MIEKKDWEFAKNQFENLFINNSINAELNSVCVEHCKKKLKEFPEEKDDMPEGLKEDLGIKNA